MKGYSTLFQLEGFGVAESVMIDYLHGVCLGVMKRMLSCWLDKRGEDFYIGDDTALINQRLKSIKTPAQVHRPPRGVHYRTYYKGKSFSINGPLVHPIYDRTRATINFQWIDTLYIPANSPVFCGISRISTLKTPQNTGCPGFTA